MSLPMMWKARPEALGQVLAVPRVAERGEVVEQRVEPDVDHLARVPGQRALPRSASAARARRPARPPLDERRAPRCGGSRGARSRGAPRRGARAAPGRPRAGRTSSPPARASSGILWIGQVLPSPDLRLGLEVGAARAVPALVGPLVDVAVVVDALDDLLDLGLVLGIGGADEEVVRGVDLRHQLLEPGRVAVGELAWLDALASRPPGRPARRARRCRSGRTRPRRAGACGGRGCRRRSSCRRARGGARR